MIYTFMELIGIILSLIFIIIFFLIVIFIIITGVKLMKIWKIMKLKYPTIQKQIPAFIRKKDVFGWYKENNWFIHSTVKRFIRFEALSKSKSDEYFSKAYNIELIKKQNNKELEAGFNSLIKFSKIRDEYIVLFYLTFMFVIAFGIYYSL
jgi:hypothetical protein